MPSYRLDTLVDALQVRPPSARQFHRSPADVNHTVAMWQNLHARFTEHTLRGAKVSYVDASSLCLLERHKIRKVWSTHFHLSLTGAEVAPRRS